MPWSRGDFCIFPLLKTACYDAAGRHQPASHQHQHQHQHQLPSTQYQYQYQYPVPVPVPVPRAASPSVGMPACIRPVFCDALSCTDGDVAQPPSIRDSNRATGAQGRRSFMMSRTARLQGKRGIRPTLPARPDSCGWVDLCRYVKTPTTPRRTPPRQMAPATRHRNTSRCEIKTPGLRPSGTRRTQGGHRGKIPVPALLP